MFFYNQHKSKQSNNQPLYDATIQKNNNLFVSKWGSRGTAWLPQDVGTWPVRSQAAQPSLLNLVVVDAPDLRASEKKVNPTRVLGERLRGVWSLVLAVRTLAVRWRARSLVFSRPSACVRSFVGVCACVSVRASAIDSVGHRSREHPPRNVPDRAARRRLHVPDAAPRLVVPSLTNFCSNADRFPPYYFHSVAPNTRYLFFHTKYKLFFTSNTIVF